MANYNRLKNIFDTFGDGSSYEEDGSNGIDPYQQDQQGGFMEDQNPESYDANNPDSMIDPRQNPYRPPKQRQELPPIQSTSERMKEIMDLIGQVNTPSSTSSDRYNNLLDNFPKRNAPSLGRSLTAAAMTFGDPKDGFKHGQEYMYAPYLRDVAEFKEKAGPFQQAATLENNQNVNERTLASNVANYAIQAGRTETTERDQREKNRINEENQTERNRITEQKNTADAENTRIRNEAYLFKQRHPDWKMDARGPNILVFNPATGKAESIGPSGHLSEADKINLETQGKVEVERQRGYNTANNTEAKGWAIYNDTAGNQYRGNAQTKEIEPMGDSPEEPVGNLTVARQGATSRTGSAGTTNPANLSKMRDNIIRQYVDTHEGADKLVIAPTTPNGSYQLVHPSRHYWSGKADPEQEKMYNELILLTYGQQDQPKSQNQNQAPAIYDQPKLPSETPDEQLGTVTGDVVQPRVGQVVSADDKTRENILNQLSMASSHSMDDMMALLKSPTTPSQMRRSIAIRMLQSSKPPSPITPANIQHILDGAGVQ